MCVCSRVCFVDVIAVLPAMYERRGYCGESRNCQHVCMRAKLPISRGARGVAVKASLSRTESNGRQNYAEVSPAELLMALLTEAD